MEGSVHESFQNSPEEQGVQMNDDSMSSAHSPRKLLLLHGASHPFLTAFHDSVKRTTKSD